MNLQEKFIKRRKIIEELFNVGVRDTQDPTIKDVHFYYMMKNKDEEEWSFADINLDDARKTDNQTLLDCNNILIVGLKKQFDYVKGATKEEYEASNNSKLYNHQSFALKNKD